MRKGISIILISLLLILAFALIGALVILIKSDFNFDSFDFSAGYTKTLLDEKEINSIKNLNIETEVSDIKIETKDINNIKIELYSKKVKEYEITEKDDEIKVVLIDKNSFISFGNTSLIKIFLPKDYSNTITVNGKTSDIDILNDLPNANLNVELTTGDIEVKDINNFTSSTTTGDVSIKNANDVNVTITTGDLEIGQANIVVSTGTTGDIKVKEVNDITSTVTTGDINISKVNNFMELSATTGDVLINKAVINMNSKIQTSTGDVRIKSISNCYIDAKTTTGDAKVNNNDRKSDIELVVNSRVGDIIVN